ncbi:MAG: hydantoinase/oxoprolinase family protein [Chloroflexi bacterium]|nr:hydantoinase/oxoprolinase family protein [Chloroflexota bacterium]
MNLGIGIDTGGTYTDSAVVDLESGSVLSKAKAATTRRDLTVGIGASLDGLDRSLFSQVKLVSLSTTLATNSLVEGKGSRVGLIVTLPKPETFVLPADIPAVEVAVVSGAHDKRGEVVTELDVDAVARAIELMIERVDSFAVSGYFSIYNAEHELRIKELISSVCDLPVVCGHELSERVGMIKRATTAALNARLLPVVQELLDAVERILLGKAIDALLMVVKGDGSLITEKAARERPVDTVLSGPAASIIGACRLTGLDDAVVVDMGGTTTDIAIVGRGVALPSAGGAVIGGWRTWVQAVDMWTVGLGGDSKISLSSTGEISIGPRRAIPFCVGATIDPSLARQVVELKAPVKKNRQDFNLDFFTLVRRPDFHLSNAERELLDVLDGRVVHRARLDKGMSRFVQLDRFVELGFVTEVSFTPTDLLHACGKLNLWDAASSIAAADHLAVRASTGREELLDRIYDEIIGSLKLNIVAKALGDKDETGPSHSGESLRILEHLLRLNGEDCLSASLAIRLPLIAVGAPVGMYFPRVASELGAQVVIPEHAEVANAVGAITGRVIERTEAYIRPDKPFGFIVVTADEHRWFRELEEAVDHAKEHVLALTAQKAMRSGGVEVETSISIDEQTMPLARGWGDAVLIELKITATAVGKPKIENRK